MDENGGGGFSCMAMFPLRPIWMVGEYYSHMMPVMMSQYITFMLISQLIHRANHRLHQTRFVSNLMASIIMGPSFMGRSKYLYSLLYPYNNIMPTSVLALLGINLSVFVAAVKIDSKYMIMRAGKNAFKVAVPAILFSLAVMTVCMYFLRIYVNHDLPGIYSSLLSCFYFAFSSSPNLVTALTELNLMSSETDRFAMFTGVVTDIMMWIIILGFEALRAYRGYLGHSIFFLIIISTSMIAFCIFVLRPWAKRLVNNSPKDQPVSSTYVLGFTLGAMVMFMLGGMVLGNPLLGPLLYGLCIPSGPPLGSTLVKNIELVAEEILLPFFYIQLGPTLDLAVELKTTTFHLVGGVILLGTLVKFVTITLSSRICGFNPRDSLSIGLMLNFSGLVSIYTYDRLRNIGLSDPKVTTSLIISSLLLNTIVGPLVKFIHNIELQSGNESTPGDQLINTHTIHGSRYDPEFHLIPCVYDESNVPSITRLLEISNLTLKTVPCSVHAYVIHLSEINGQTAPLFCPHFNHTRICHHNGCDKILSKFNNYTRFSKEQVIIMPFTAIAPYKTMHEEICRMAKDKNVPLIILPFYKNNTNSVDLTIDQVLGLKSVCIKMQRHAHCTVGILLEKSPSTSIPNAMKKGTHHNHNHNHKHNHNNNHNHHHRHKSTNKYYITVIFIGGVDDREALSYGLRMLGRPGLKVTLLHILMTDEWGIAYKDEDMALVEEFKTKCDSTKNASYHDIVVENLGRAIEVTRRFVRKSDLVIVGQQQGTSSVWLQEGMQEWMENPELGVIGDMLAYEDTKSRVTSVLVLHHHGQIVEIPDIHETEPDINCLQWKKFTFPSIFSKDLV